ncbi:hypothetical protein ACK1CN_05275 [Vibrio coralliilyticus]|uniref:hypothetical protein n=1 Tax=Vibrio coralliilyticus TaxID=190893 RepID=UPI0039171D5D
MNQRFKISALVVSLAVLAGCSAKQEPDRLSYLIQWDKKWQECSEITKTSTAQFPTTPWFDSLSEEDKKHVLIYTYNLKEYECAENESQALKEVLSGEDIKSIGNLLKGFVYFEKPDSEDVKHLDQDKIDELAEKAPMFNLQNAARQLGFI